MKKLSLHIGNIWNLVEKTWHNTLCLAVSILFVVLTELEVFSGISIFWKVIIALTPLIISYPIAYFVSKKRKNVMTNIVEYQLVTKLKEIRKLAHFFPPKNKDNNKFGTVMCDICQSVYDALANVNETKKTMGYSKYCVIVSFLGKNSGTPLFTPLYSDGGLMAKEYFELIPKDYEFRLCDNSSYDEVYHSYHDSPHKPKIKLTSRVKDKVKEGKCSSSFTTIKNVGMNNMPYESSCVMPILPFFNENCQGDEMQGFLAILAENPNIFPESEEEMNKELYSFFESVSGYLYKVCNNNESAN